MVRNIGVADLKHNVVGRAKAAKILSLPTSGKPTSSSIRRDCIRIKNRTPIGYYRVPHYLRGKAGLVDSVIEPVAVDNEEEGYGRNAGSRLYHYAILTKPR